MDRKAQAARLKSARESCGYDTASDAARALNVGLSTYLAHENGTRSYRNYIDRYARAFKVTTDWLLTGRGAKGDLAQTTAVVGYIGAGAEVFPMDAYTKGSGLELVPAPQGISSPCVAALVRGSSMYPAMEDGWLVFWTKDHDGVLEECVGKLCAVQIEDGPLLVKKLRLGSIPGHWTLSSFNAPPLENVRVAWASRIVDIRPA